jgi:hypothetical protein
MEGTCEFGHRIWRHLHQALVTINDSVFRQHIDEIDARDHGREVVVFLARLIHSDVQELAPRFSPDALLLLRKHSPERVIHTQLGMTARYVQMLEDPRWDLLVSISELGKVLRRIPDGVWTVAGPTGTRRRKASIVVADPHEPQPLEQRLTEYRQRELIIGQDYRLPYWAHNDHIILTLRMSLQPGEFEPLSAISYRLPGLENRVNPVFVEDRDDLDMLMQIYFGYVTKAEAYMKLRRDEVDARAVSGVATGPERGGVPDVTQAQAAETRGELLMRWWQAMVRLRTPALPVADAGAPAA